MRVFWSAGALCLLSLASLAQEAATVRDAAVESYFHRKAAARGDAPVALKELRRTPVDGTLAAILMNDWLTWAITIQASDAEARSDAAPSVESEPVDSAVDAFFGFTPASPARVDATLHTLGLTLDDVLEPPTGPYYNNGRGLYYYKRERRFLLVARGVRDASKNECFKAAIDLTTGNVLTNATTLCTME